jgi:hypothetical protein
MPADPFAPLDTEIARWREAGRRLPLWLRDDDAVDATPALDRLIALADRHGLPLHLAVIPQGATPALAARVARAPGVRPVVHGWAHANHEPRGQKRCEFGPARDPSAALADAARGLARLRDLFGDRLLPVFVPPWNRIAPGVAAGLPALGYSTLSAAPGATPPVPGLGRIDRDLDPVDWRGTRSVIHPRRLATLAAAALADRRAMPVPAPFGLLTHHLAHDAAVWDFVAAFLARLAPVAAPLDLATHRCPEPAP